MATLRFANDYTGGVLQNGNLDTVQKAWAKLGYNPEVHSLPTLKDAKLTLSEARMALKVAKEKLKVARLSK